MISPVDPYLEAFADAGADIITAHVEATPHVHRTLQAIRKLGKQVGVTLNPGTPVSSLESVIGMGRHGPGDVGQSRLGGQDSSRKRRSACAPFAGWPATGRSASRSMAGHTL